VKEFYKVAEQTGGIRIEDQARIFKVIKTPVPLEKQPTEIQGLLGYEFYQIERPTGRPREFNLEVDPSADLTNLLCKRCEVLTPVVGADTFD